MKKTKKISLVLISAALASCNREFVPVEPAGYYAADSALTAAPVYGADSGRINCIPCYQAYSLLWNYPFNPSGFYVNGFTSDALYYPGRIYRQKVVWQGKHVVVRGGWGKSGRSGSSSS